MIISERQKNYLLAKRKLDEIKAVKTHFIIYMIVNLIIGVGSIIMKGDSDLWFLFPVVGGVGFITHYINVYHQNLFFNKKWELKTLKKLIKKIEKEETHMSHFFKTKYMGKE